jgi:ribosomal protein L11 methylase PrmA
MRNRTLDAYERLLQGAEPAGMPLTTLLEACRILHARMGPVTIVDLGSGGGHALLSLVASARAQGTEARGIGIDKDPPAVTRCSTAVHFIRADLDDDWPLREHSVHLALSRAAKINITPQSFVCHNQRSLFLLI